MWNETLAEFGEDVASGCVFEHSGGPYGENLAAGEFLFLIKVLGEEGRWEVGG